MRARQKAIDSYGEVNVVSGVNSADNVQLIQMLMVILPMQDQIGLNLLNLRLVVNV